jgi:ribosome maturation protein Sdo1
LSKHTIARFHIRGETFEIFVKPDEALDYKLRKVGDLSKILLTDVVYSDANKGMKASTDKLIKNFQTADTLQVAKIILDKGELLLTAEQRKKLVEEKKSRIIDIIHKHCIANTPSKDRTSLRANSHTYRSIQTSRSTSEWHHRCIKAHNTDKNGNNQNGPHNPS